jgi:hypothetical protein
MCRFGNFSPFKQEKARFAAAAAAQKWENPQERKAVPYAII